MVILTDLLTIARDGKTHGSLYPNTKVSSGNPVAKEFIVPSKPQNLLFLQGLKGTGAGSAHRGTQAHEDSDKGQQRGRQQNIAQSNRV